MTENTSGDKTHDPYFSSGVHNGHEFAIPQDCVLIKSGKG